MQRNSEASHDSSSVNVGSVVADPAVVLPSPGAGNSELEQSESTFEVETFAKRFDLKLKLTSITEDWTTTKVRSQFLRCNLPVNFGPLSGNSSILVRNCYKDLYELGVTFALESESGSQLGNEGPAVLFTGIPGIGMSRFMVYFLFRFLNDARFPDKRFALELAPGIFQAFMPTSNPEEYHKSVKSAEWVKENQMTVFGDVNDRDVIPCRSKRLFVFSRMDPAISQQILNRPLSIKFTIPVWKRDEIERLNSNVNSWDNRFQIFGGIPRHLFEPTNLTESFKGYLEANRSFIAQEFHRHAFNDSEPALRDMLVHFNPPKKDDKFDYAGEVIPSFASFEIADTIIKYSDRESMNRLKQGINDGTAIEQYGIPMIDILFKLMFRYNPPLGQTIRAKSLEGGPDLLLTFPTEIVQIPSSLLKCSVEDSDEEVEEESNDEVDEDEQP